MLWCHRWLDEITETPGLRLQHPKKVAQDIDGYRTLVNVVTRGRARSDGTRWQGEVNLQKQTLVNAIQVTLISSLLAAPFSNTVESGRAYRSAAPLVWNALPIELRTMLCMNDFKKYLKTSLFGGPIDLCLVFLFPAPLYLLLKLSSLLLMLWNMALVKHKCTLLLLYYYGDIK